MQNQETACLGSDACNIAQVRSLTWFQSWVSLRLSYQEMFGTIFYHCILLDFCSQDF